MTYKVQIFSQQEPLLEIFDDAFWSRETIQTLLAHTSLLDVTDTLDLQHNHKRDVKVRTKNK